MIFLINYFLQLFRRLSSDGLNDVVEMQLLSMKTFLLKLKHKTQHDIADGATGSDNNNYNSNNRRIIINRKHVFVHEYPLEDKTGKLNLDGGSANIGEGLTTIASPSTEIIPHSAGVGREQ